MDQGRVGAHYGQTEPHISDAAGVSRAARNCYEARKLLWW